MKKSVFIFLLFLSYSLLFFVTGVEAQCSICTKTASQLGEKPAAALNTAIIYLMGAPFAIVGFIAWRWWRSNKQQDQ